MAELFGLKKGDLENIIAILQNERNLEEALIFDSRAKGCYKNGSDVDIALKGKHLDHESVLMNSYLLNEETLMPYQFDVLNYNTISNKDLTDHIDRSGILFYKKTKS